MGVKSIRNQHQLVVELVPRLDRYGPPVIELRVRVYVTDLGGNALPPKIANRRRKRIAKGHLVQPPVVVTLRSRRTMVCARQRGR